MKMHELDLNGLLSREFHCPCGKTHRVALKEAVIERGAIFGLPALIKKYGRKPFLLADENTWRATGEQAAALLRAAGIPFSSYLYEKRPHPEEKAMGEVVFHFDPSCDLILGVGSGTINDLSKALAACSGRPYILLATAPSMDGLASDTSSMAVGGVKVSLPTCCPTAILADTEILKAAPAHMAAAGLGDMFAKYVSILEWRISNLVNGEYYCPEVAELVRRSLGTCASSAPGLMRGEEAAFKSLAEGLILSGVAMSFAGVTRPASGMEHYFSHLFDMRALEFGTPEELHGIQVGIGTALSLKLYRALQKLTPDREKALAAAAAFDKAIWAEELRDFLGSGAESLIALEEKEGKYDREKHAPRLERIIARWPEILGIIEEELQGTEEALQSLKAAGGYTRPEEMGIDRETAVRAYRTTKDIRDKYIGTRLLWDLGELEAFQKYIG